jgi:hypothetical protein
MSDKRVFVAVTTTHGLMQSRFLEGVMDLFRSRTFDMEISMFVDPYIVSARNTAAADFLESKCTHLMFIDADIIFLAAHIERLLSHDEAIVGGLYPKKCEGPMKWVCNALPERPPIDERGLLPLRHIGTGFMLIKRVVFEAMLQVESDKLLYYEDEIDRPLWNFFRMPLTVDDKGKPRLVSEDWNFCNVARERGFKVYADTNVILKHIGTVVFPLKTQVKESQRDRDRRVA